MGGLGSTRWRGHHRKTRADECRWVSVATLVGDELPAAGRTGRLVLAGDGCDTGLVIGFRFLTERRVVFIGGGRLPVWALDLTSTGTPNGGVRYLARCPLRVGDRACGRLVAKLYRPPGESGFGCRLCHRLTYRSRQGHDKRVTALLEEDTDLPGVPLGELSCTDLGLLMAVAAEWRRRVERDRKRRGPKPRPRRRR